jgi:hypothetical protein
MFRGTACVSVALLLSTILVAAATSAPNARELSREELRALTGGTSEYGCWPTCMPCNEVFPCSTGICTQPYGPCPGLLWSHEGTYAEKCQTSGMWNEICQTPPPNTKALCYVQRNCKCILAEDWTWPCVEDSDYPTRYYYFAGSTDWLQCWAEEPPPGAAWVNCP